MGTWSAERTRVIAELKSIKDEVQRQAEIHSIGSITYSSVGIVGGGLALAGIIAAPFTLGASLGLTVAGVATGVTSGAAGLTHALVKLGIISSKCSDAKTNLENHGKTSDEMRRLLEELKKDVDKIKAYLREKNEIDVSQTLNGIKCSGGAVALTKGVSDLVFNSKAVHVYRITGNADEVAKILSLNKKLAKLLPSAVKDVSNGAVKLSAKVLDVITAIGIIVDLGSLVASAVDLSDMKKGELCDEAKKLAKVIKTLQSEYDSLAELF
jgi:hypothetical protein